MCSKRTVNVMVYFWHLCVLKKFVSVFSNAFLTRTVHSVSNLHFSKLARWLCFELFWRLFPSHTCLRNLLAASERACYPELEKCSLYGTTRCRDLLAVLTFFFALKIVSRGRPRNDDQIQNFFNLLGGRLKQDYFIFFLKYSQIQFTST